MTQNKNDRTNCIDIILLFFVINKQHGMMVRQWLSAIGRQGSQTTKEG